MNFGSITWFDLKNPGISSGFLRFCKKLKVTNSNLITAPKRNICSSYISKKMILHLKVLRQNQKKAILKSAKRSVLNYWYLLNHCGLMIFMRIIQKRSFFRCSYIRAIPKATASGIFWQVLTVPWLPFFQSSGCSVVAKRRKGVTGNVGKKEYKKQRIIIAKFYGIARNLKKTNTKRDKVVK